MNFSNGAYPRKPSGFGLIEIMIAMTLGIVIILGITTLFADTSKSLASVDRSGRQIENALFTLELLASELSLAGYWGGANYPVDAETQIFVSGEVPPAAPSGLNWNVATEVPPTCLGTGATISGTSDNAKAELAFAMEYPVVFCVRHYSEFRDYWRRLWQQYYGTLQLEFRLFCYSSSG